MRNTACYLALSNRNLCVSSFIYVHLGVVPRCSDNWPLRILEKRDNFLQIRVRPLTQKLISYNTINATVGFAMRLQCETLNQQYWWVLVSSLQTAAKIAMQKACGNQPTRGQFQKKLCRRFHLSPKMLKSLFCRQIISDLLPI